MGLLKIIGGIVIFFWLLGFIFEVAGGVIHLLLIVAAVVFIVDFVFGRSRSK